jgi:hypothetical protein
MVSKAGRGPSAPLICCDCALPQAISAQLPTGQEQGQRLLTTALVAVFVATAVVLMAIKDQQLGALAQQQKLQLDQRRSGSSGNPENKRWILIPSSSIPGMGGRSR